MKLNYVCSMFESNGGPFYSSSDNPESKNGLTPFRICLLPFVCFCLLSGALEAGDAAVRVRGERRMLLQRRLSGVSHQLHPGPLSGHTRGVLCPRLGRKLII